MKTPNSLKSQNPKPLFLDKYDLFGTFLHNVALAGGQSLVTPMRMSSIEASCMFGDGALDFVFIDSDHSYASTINDINAWLPKLARGGILCGHDCEVRLDYTNEVHFRKHQGADCIPALSSSFLVNHPGVIIAVGEIFGTSAHLWAEEEMVLTDGRRGRATLWDVTL